MKQWKKNFRKNVKNTAHDLYLADGTGVKTHLSRWPDLPDGYSARELPTGHVEVFMPDGLTSWGVLDREKFNNLLDRWGAKVEIEQDV